MATSKRGNTAPQGTDVRVNLLRKNFGYVGYALLCYMREMIHAAKGMELEYGNHNKRMYALDFGLPQDKFDELMKALVESFYLLKYADGKLSCEDFEDEKKELEEKREAKKRAGKASAAARAAKQRSITFEDCPDVPLTCCSVDVPKTDTEWVATVKASLKRLCGIDFETEHIKEWKATFDLEMQAKCKQHDSDSDYRQHLFNWIRQIVVSKMRGPSTLGRVKLGPGEYIEEGGRRTYGRGVANIPMSTPARPDENHYWDCEKQDWYI